MSSFSIYMISNDTNDKVYIGQTTRTIYERFEEHCNCNPSPIGQIIQSIGREHFSVSLLDDTATSLDELAEKEEFYIQKYNSIENGYNSRPASKARELVPEKTGVLVNMDKTLKERLTELAKKQNRSLSNLIVTILKDYVDSADK